MSRSTALPKDAASNALPPAGHLDSKVRILLPLDSTDADFAVKVAATLCRPDVSAAAVIETWQRNTHDINALAEELRCQVNAVNRGDLRRAEGMLISQAHVLENMFAILARRATEEKYLKQWDVYMRMAMKAQNQCRMTLETLATIKNPPVVFAKQANINNGGQQQVNNTTVPESRTVRASAHAGNSGICQNKLLEERDEQRLDARKTSTAGRANSNLVPVEAINWPSNRRG